jgi:hypothetical protein
MKYQQISVCGGLLLLLLIGLGTAWGQQSVISLSSVVIDTERTPPDISAHLKVGNEQLVFDDMADNEYVLVKFPAPLSAAQIAALAEVSERIYTYLPYFAYLVKMPVYLHGKAGIGATGASWIGPYHPAYKLSPAIQAVGEQNLLDKDWDQQKLPVLLHVYPDADLGLLRQRVSSIGVKRIVAAGGTTGFARMRLLLTPAEVAELRDRLAQLRQVFWIELESRRVLLNDTTIWVGQSGTAGGQTTPLFAQGIFGEGQVVGILDTGIDPDMCWFRDTTQGLPPTNECDYGTVVDPSQRKVIAVDFLWSSECAGGISGSEWDTHDHGTHVAGIVGGDDFANPLFHDTADGMAPGAQLVIQDGGFQTDDCADMPAIGCPAIELDPIFEQAYNQGARIHTNSWGDRENFTPQNTYSAGSQDADEVMWANKDFLLLFAAGNSGPSSGTVGSPSTAKNVVSVGATLRGSSADSMASFSSCGPVADGRIKPDVTIPGSSIISANNDGNITSNNCNTTSMSGTSMASPAAAGLTALIRQYFDDGWYPTGAPVTVDGFAPSAALMKAALISSAVDMANVAAIPSDCQGWGRILLDNVLYFAGDTRKLLVHDEPTGFSSPGQSQEWNLSITSSGEPFKVTLVWTDFPSTPAANPNLNNDLDLVVSGPGGTWLGNVFSGGQSTSGGSTDRLNNVEQVLLLTPGTGAYTVTVSAYNIPNGSQDFALVVTGAISTCSPAAIADAGPDQAVCLGSSAQIGTPALPDHTYSWSPGGMTEAQPTVSPTVTTTYTVTATTSCGSNQDSVLVSVDDGTGAGLDDDLEGDTSGWSTSGLWHLVDSSTCASPGYSSPTHAFYYGQDGTCDYATGSQTSGDLISPVMSGIVATSTLSFDYFRQVESYSGAYDKTEVAVATAGSGSWTTVWSRDSSDASENAWTASGAIDLSAWDGQSIEVRFRFDSLDGSYNTFVGWLIDDLVVTGESPCSDNTPPTVTITAPHDLSTYTEGDSVTFTGTADDAEDGDLSASISWSSSLDGVFGNGGSVTTSALSVGTHTITASVTDSGALPGSDTITITIDPDNTPPTVTITAPPDLSTYTEGDSVTFTGTADDAEDGDLTASISWSSSLDGVFGSGGSVTTSTLSVGTHTITASVTDSGALPGSDTITITINPVGPTCDLDESFETDFAGWSSSDSTCSKGDFVRGTPAEMTSGGVITQVGGAHNGSNALYTAANTNPNKNDVDRGNCILVSPVYNVTAASNVVAWYFHGQEEQGDDPAGDFFKLEVSINGGAWISIASYGDITVNAAWTQALTTAAAGDTVQLRVQVSDGKSDADLIEGGIDSVSICAQ